MKTLYGIALSAVMASAFVIASEVATEVAEAVEVTTQVTETVEYSEIRDTVKLLGKDCLDAEVCCPSEERSSTEECRSGECCPEATTDCSAEQN